MARLPRVIGLDLPHHVTQRGNARRFILDGDTRRRIYMYLLTQSLGLHAVALIGYCLMSNHVYLILIPRKAESLGWPSSTPTADLPPVGMPPTMRVVTFGRADATLVLSTKHIFGKHCARR